MRTDELVKRVRAGDVTLIDVRPREEYLAGHLPGAISDRAGPKPFIVWGMWVQAAGIVVVALGNTLSALAAGAALFGIGTRPAAERRSRTRVGTSGAMVCPALLATIGDVAHPSWRAPAVDIYRLWRDLGYAIGALLAGVTADAFGPGAAMGVIAALTFASGVMAAARMTETSAVPFPALPDQAPTTAGSRRPWPHRTIAAGTTRQE